MEKGSRVSIEYTLTLEDGSVVASNVGEEPLVYEHGGDEILPALEATVGDLDVGETRTVTLPPEDAFGPVDPEAFQLVPHDTVPEEARCEGARLTAADAHGNEHPIRVREVRADGIVLDLNHPLAGETLTFEVKVIAVHPADDAPA